MTQNHNKKGHLADVAASKDHHASSHFLTFFHVSSRFFTFFHVFRVFRECKFRVFSAFLRLSLQFGGLVPRAVMSLHVFSRFFTFFESSSWLLSKCLWPMLSQPKALLISTALLNLIGTNCSKPVNVTGAQSPSDEVGTKLPSAILSSRKRRNWSSPAWRQSRGGAGT